MLNKGITIKARIGLTMAFLAALLVAIGVFGLVRHEPFERRL